MKRVVLFVFLAGSLAGFAVALDRFRKKPDLARGIGLAVSAVGVASSLKAL